MLVARSPDTEELLAGSLAAELGARPLGTCATADEARLLASRSGCSRLFVCEVLEYVPYDPSRIVVRLAEFEVSPPGIPAAAAMRLFRDPAAETSPGAARPLRTALVGVDAGDDGVLREYALREGLPASESGLLEAQVLLRDPARFLPLAAGAIAAALRASPENRALPGAPEVSAADSTAVGAPDVLSRYR